MKSRFKNKNYINIGLLFGIVFFAGCKISNNPILTEDKSVPSDYLGSTDTINVADQNWRLFLSDTNLISLIDTALRRNQELNILLQEIQISKNEIMARKGEYLPFVDLKAGSEVGKPGNFTRDGAVERQLEIMPGKEFPEPLSDFSFGAVASWELDIWKKLRNSKKAAIENFLATQQGRNFMVTNLISEISESYYELMALDNMLEIIEKNIRIQSDAFMVVKQQKEAAKVTQLAVNRFEAQLLNTRNLQYSIRQRIIERENRIHFLIGKFDQPVKRSSENFLQLSVDSIQAGIPTQLLRNRPDLMLAEHQLAAAKLNVKVARANFYPSLDIKAGIGFQAFNPAFLINPESLMYNLAGDIMAPLVNRNAIKSAYNTASAQQIQAVYSYQQNILNAYLDVQNQLSKVENYTKRVDTKKQEVDILMQSVSIASSLFNSARANYAEVLLTQREALESKMDLVEIKMQQLIAEIDVYRALGGGWR